MSDRDRRLYRPLSVLVIVALVAFLTVWIPAIVAGPAGALSLIVSLLLLGYVCVWIVQWIALPRMIRPRALPAPDGLRVAAVTTFVPSHESLAMLERTLTAMVAMEGEHDNWLLDEGNEEPTIALCERLGVLHFSRHGVPGYNTESGHFRAASKHGNYNAWLDAIGYGRYEVLSAFDADHVPERDYLARTIGYFRDERIAFVQPAQVYYNQEASFIARAAAEETYAYYSSHLMASYALGHSVVVGSHSVYWLPVLQEVGGFPAHDAEDLYLTMVYKAAGWQGVYVPEVLAQGTTPSDWTSYLNQQRRWARSVLDLKLRVLPKLAGELRPFERVINFLHGAYFLRSLALPVLFGLFAYVLIAGVVPSVLTPRAVSAFALLMGVLWTVNLFRQRYYLNPPRERGMQWRSTLMQFAKWPTFLHAVGEALAGGAHAYAVTRKDGYASRRWILAPTQLMVAILVAAAWTIGFTRHGAPAPMVTACAALVVAIASGLAWTEAWRSAPSYVESLHEARHGGTR